MAFANITLCPLFKIFGELLSASLYFIYFISVIRVEKQNATAP